MTLIAAITFLMDHYEEVDPSHEYAPLMCEIISEPPAEILKILLAPPPEGMDEVNRTMEDWQADVEAAETPKLAALTVIDWLEAKVEDEANARAFREYLDQGPDKATYNSSPTAPT